MIAIDPAAIAEKFTRHGGAFDRGSADSYYSRPRNPHMYPLGTYHPPKVELVAGTAEYEAYMMGYDHNESTGDKKDWG